jgi:hypothetical protein
MRMCIPMHFRCRPPTIAMEYRDSPPSKSNSRGCMSTHTSVPRPGSPPAAACTRSSPSRRPHPSHRGNRSRKTLLSTSSNGYGGCVCGLCSIVWCIHMYACMCLCSCVPVCVPSQPEMSQSIVPTTPTSSQSSVLPPSSTTSSRRPVVSAQGQQMAPPAAVPASRNPGTRACVSVCRWYVSMFHMHVTLTHLQRLQWACNPPTCAGCKACYPPSALSRRSVVDCPPAAPLSRDQVYMQCVLCSAVQCVHTQPRISRAHSLQPHTFQTLPGGQAAASAVAPPPGAVALPSAQAAAVGAAARAGAGPGTGHSRCACV